jgi:hypothetical protein
MIQFSSVFKRNERLWSALRQGLAPKINNPTNDDQYLRRSEIQLGRRVGTDKHECTPDGVTESGGGSERADVPIGGRSVVVILH